MNTEKLHEIGEPLEVTRDDIREFYEKRREERRRKWLQKKVFWFWTLMSGFLALCLEYAYYAACNTAAYPYSYERPGGKTVPILVFGGVAASGGLLAMYCNRRKSSPWIKEQNKNILKTVIVSFLVFTLVYLWADRDLFGGGLLYGVHFREDHRANEFHVILKHANLDEPELKRLKYLLPQKHEYWL